MKRIMSINVFRQCLDCGYEQFEIEEVKVGDVVDVWVMNVDINKKRISLTMRKPKENK